MPQEIHIAGIVIHARAAELRAIRSYLALLPGAQVHAVSDEGKLVATLETDSTKRTVDYMDAIRALRGVLNVALVYQHAEPSSALDEEVET
ncbi:chaperone NapD [Noviherbaspirillum sp. UKPF54]|uniref:chaperone NapD n=1 Tax=Noviherbaspirillum sp. UKPF54 TaxID=2601898 RepID=UPI0011B1AAE9|nr:chaperone NapD [Noviherbaspirillum sp. UKPF54]QDZ28520.1 sorbose reductase [Noviherbaspirillum sp. UKPF54]